MLVFEDVALLDVAGPSEVFAVANLYGGNYRMSLLSVDGGSVRTSGGLRIQTDGAAARDQRWDTLLVAGGEPFPAHPVPDALASTARHLAAQSGRVASVCTGAFVLGAAGLLDERRATTHWRHTAELASRHPRTRAEPDRIFVKDGSMFSSAGITAGIDLALALLEEDEGSDLTRAVAKHLVVYLRRPGGQSQFSGPLAAPVAKTSAVRAVTDHVTGDPTADYSLDALARIARVSPRHLARLFREELNTTPVRHVEAIRFELAKSHLDAGRSVTLAAELSGFGSPETLRRAFVHRLGVSPQRYQRRFRSTGVAEAVA